MKNFNIITAGYGGQGILTLTEIITRVALRENYNVKEAELHGLAQRGGSLQCHIKIKKGKEEIYSALVRRADADLIIALDPLEALRACYWADKNKTIMLINHKTSKPYLSEDLDVDEILKKIKKFVRKLELVKADEIVEKLTGNIRDVNTFMLGYAAKKKILPFEKKNVWGSIEEKLHKRSLDENKKVFEAALRGC